MSAVNQWPVYLTSGGVPYVDYSQPALASSLGPETSASPYRTIGGNDIRAALTGQLATSSTGEIGVTYALAYMATLIGPAIAGRLVTITNGIPKVAAAGVDGYAMQAVGSHGPQLDTAQGTCNAATVGQDARLFWLYRTFGKR